MHHEYAAFYLNPVFWVAVSFLVFWVIAWKPIAGGIGKALDARGDRIRREIEEAGRLRREAEAMLADATARRGAALTEAAEMVRNAEAEVARMTERAAADLSESTARREKAALERIATAEADAMTALRREAADLSIQAAHRLVSETLDAANSTKLTDRAIADLPARMH